MIKGFRGTSLVDYPGEVSAVVFTGGCNLRCPYCYNKQLVLPELLKELSNISEDYILSEVARRRNFIKAVVVTGGEPALHKEKLISFLKRLRELPIKIKLDTNGTFPQVILRILEERLIDFIAIDIKTSPSKYPTLGGKWEYVAETLEIVKNFDVVKEARITAVPGFVDYGMLQDVAPFLDGMDRISIQKFVNRNTVDPEWEKITPYTPDELVQFKNFIEKIRGQKAPEYHSG